MRYTALYGLILVVFLFALPAQATWFGNVETPNIVNFNPLNPANSGYRLVFDDEFTSCNTIDLNATSAPGFNWYVTRWFGYANEPSGTFSCGPNGLTINTANNNAGQWAMATAAPIGPCCANQAFIGRAFGGGFFIEAQISFDTTTVTSTQFPAFWSYTLEYTMDGGILSHPSGTVPGFVTNEEIDFFEKGFAAPGQQSGWIYPTSESGAAVTAGGPLTAGIAFTVSSANSESGVAFWKPSTDTITSRNVYLWNSSGTVLAQATTASEPTGTAQWITQKFAAPIALTSGTTYYVGFDIPSGSHYATATRAFPTNQTIISATGSFSASSTGTFPQTNTGSTSFLVDTLLYGAPYYTSSMHERYGVPNTPCTEAGSPFYGQNTLCQLDNNIGDSNPYQYQSGVNPPPYANNGMALDTIPTAINWMQPQTIGFLWVPATAANGYQGYFQNYLNGTPMCVPNCGNPTSGPFGAAGRTGWVKNGSLLGSWKSPFRNSYPWTDPSAFGLVDDVHQFIILGSGTNLPFTIRFVHVWQLPGNPSTIASCQTVGGCHGFDQTANYPMNPASSNCQISQQCIFAYLKGANFNSTADQPIQILQYGNVGSGQQYELTDIFVTNCSTSLTAALGGIYTGAGKTGTAIGSASTSWSGCTGGTATQHQASLTNEGVPLSASPLYLSLTTPQGSTATGDIYFVGVAIPK